ncbi:MAG: T9SS type A sorting domain-containing protein [Flavobacteriales bacterium]|nr:T9SS type A sorting domain-containing protein [Flavobacteriales bacterium]
MGRVTLATDLPAGIYLVRLQQDDVKLARKVMVGR